MFFYQVNVPEKVTYKERGFKTLNHKDSSTVTLWGRAGHLTGKGSHFPQSVHHTLQAAARQQNNIS